MNHELEKEIRKFEQDSYFREDSDFSSAFSDDSALDLDDDDEDEDDENSNESESTQGQDEEDEEEQSENAQGR